MSKEHRLAYVAPEPILLINHSDDDTPPEVEDHVHNHTTAGLSSHQEQEQEHIQEHDPVWARDCRVGECTIIKGTNGQRFAVWSVEIQTSSHGTVKVFKRYSEFEQLRRQLIEAFPNKQSSIPQLPGKKAFGNLQNNFLLKRRRGLEYFLSCVVLNPVLGNSETVRKFVIGE